MKLNRVEIMSFGTIRKWKLVIVEGTTEICIIKAYQAGILAICNPYEYRCILISDIKYGSLQYKTCDY